MKKFITILIIALFTLPTVKADEGMWFLAFINKNYQQMKAMGFKLTPKDIYDINNSSMKDAVVTLDGGSCTAELVSPNGLILTNHHCGFGEIQAHSTLENDYLTNGFWAMDRSQELPNPGKSVTFLVRMEDVSDKVNAVLNNKMSEEEREMAIRNISQRIEKEATGNTHYEAQVRSFFEGNNFYLFIYETFNDIRLVGAPPSSIGKFGADTDNWMWPRHTGDFALFRVYTGPDGKPAPYAKENVPLKPKHHLPISTEGIQEGDFSMIMGYPGNTDRYLVSYGIDLNINSTYPTRIDIRRKKLDIMMEDMQADPAVRIKYSSKYAGIANYWKNFIGMSSALKKLKVADRKRDLEQKMALWIASDRARSEKYGSVLKEMEEAYKAMDAYNIVRFYYIEAIRSGSELLSLSGEFVPYVKYLEGDGVTAEKTANYITRYETRLSSLFKDLNIPTDQKLLAAMLEMYYANVPVQQQPQMLRDLGKKYKGDFSKYAAKVFGKTIFSSRESILAAMKKGDPKLIQKDPLYQLALAFEQSMEPFKPQMDAINLTLSKNKRLFMAALMEMEKDKDFYPNANFTMRLTYGKVKGYSPADAIEYNFITTMDGIMEKEDPNNWEFVVPAKLKELYKNQDFGPYRLKDGRMPVGFLTDHDITGGNSGSPVINGNGELIGLAFDGNWEAMSGDIHFESELQRTINVDIRYVLFIIDKYAGARNLIDEMTIVRE
jgi:hypothetical protein